jgi:opacity protein-like surface antigen
MKKIISVLLLGALSTSVYAGDNDWSGHASLYFGKKFLDSKDWKDTGDKASSGGLVTDFKRESWPVSIAVDLIGSEKETFSKGNRTENTIGELDLGVRKIWSLSPFISPYVGGGIAFVGVENQTSTASGNKKLKGDTVGAWAGAGAYVSLTEKFVVGLDMRYTQAEVKLAGDKRDAGGFNAGITAGLTW